MTKILILNGPDLSAKPSAKITAAAKKAGVEIDYRQHDKLANVITWMRKADADTDAIIFNPAKDITVSAELYRRAVEAMSKCDIPLTEVHLDNIYAKDEGVPHSNRQAANTTGIICGLGDYGYVLAINAIAENLGK